MAEPKITIDGKALEQCNLDELSKAAHTLMLKVSTDPMVEHMSRMIDQMIAQMLKSGRDVQRVAMERKPGSGSGS